MSKGARMTVDVRAVGRTLLRGTRRAALTVVGFALVGLGVAGLVLPVLPGWLLILAGLAMLAREYSWASSALETARRQAVRSGASLRSLASRRRPAVVDLSSEMVIDLTPARDARQLAGLGELKTSDLG
jgi:hypothetical protein